MGSICRGRLAGIAALSALVFLTGCATPLMKAINRNDIAAVNDLLGKGASTAQTSNSCTWATYLGTFSMHCDPLMLAAEKGQIEIMKVLLDKGANIDAAIGTHSAIWFSIVHGQLDAFKILLDRGAKYEDLLSNTDLLDTASWNWGAEMVGILVEKGADVDEAIARLENPAAHQPNRDGASNQLIRLLKKFRKQPIAASPSVFVAQTVPAALNKEDMQRMMEDAVKSVAQAQAKTTEPAPKTELISDVDKPKYKNAESAGNFAVVVGIEKYNSLPEAQFAERDALAVREHLLALGYPQRNIILLSGAQATKTGLVKNIETWLPRNVTEQSTVFFYYSGHGAPEVTGGQAYLVPVDGDPEYLEDTGYS